jgi:hypothetical protein
VRQVHVTTYGFAIFNTLCATTRGKIEAKGLFARNQDC